MSRRAGRVLIVACGALAGELVRIKRLNDWEQLDVQCLPSELHNRPERIAPAVEQKILDKGDEYERIIIGYADCGTGGGLDRIAEKYGAARIPGAHCYEFFAGSDTFNGLVERETGTFYLTDYLTRNFDRLIVKGMGMDRHPELKDMLFGNYRKLVYLAQTDDESLDLAAKRAASFLDLDFERVPTGLDSFRQSLEQMV